MYTPYDLAQTKAELKKLQIAGSHPFQKRQIAAGSITDFFSHHGHLGYATWYSIWIPNVFRLAKRQMHHVTKCFQSLLLVTCVSKTQLTFFFNLMCFSKLLSYFQQLFSWVFFNNLIIKGILLSDRTAYVSWASESSANCSPFKQFYNMPMSFFSQNFNLDSDNDLIIAFSSSLSSNGIILVQGKSTSNWFVHLNRIILTLREFSKARQSKGLKLF